MNNRSFVFTSESVSEGHPDKVADQISDGILDSLLREDPTSRVACETMVKNGVVILAGEVTSKANLEPEKVVRQVIRDIGYCDPDIGFDSETCEIMTFVNAQSDDISVGVTEGKGAFDEQGAGDQGLMFGFACKETPEYLPLPISLSHRLVEELARARKAGEVDYLRPDSKSQVTVRYEGTTPKCVDTVVLSTQHSDNVSSEELEQYIKTSIIDKVVPENFRDDSIRVLVNPTGRFVVGGPVADCGLTGRKIIVDTYGGYSRHGGGAFSGKDPSKVDRSAAYASRYLAKNIVAAGLAERCEVQVAYAIGVAEPVSVLVDTFGTGTVAEEKIESAAKDCFDLRPKKIIESLNLLRPIYQATAAYGHFGRNADNGFFPWEEIDKTEALKASAR